MQERTQKASTNIGNGKCSILAKYTAIPNETVIYYQGRKEGWVLTRQLETLPHYFSPHALQSPSSTGLPSNYFEICPICFITISTSLDLVFIISHLLYYINLLNSLPTSYPGGR